MHDKVLVIIPAKKHSERLPGKNFLKVGNRTLLDRAIDSALAINYPVLATDYTILYPGGRCAPCLLSGDLTADGVQLETVARRVYDVWGEGCHTIVLLQPTSPFRTAKHVKEAYQQFVDGGYDSLFSGYETPAFIWAHAGARGMLPVNYDPSMRPRSQDAMKLVVENGAIYIFSVEMFLQTKCRLGGRIGVYLMSELESLEIDTPEDYEAAKIIYGGMNAKN